MNNNNNNNNNNIHNNLLIPGEALQKEVMFPLWTFPWFLIKPYMSISKFGINSNSNNKPIAMLITIHHTSEICDVLFN